MAFKAGLEVVIKSYESVLRERDDLLRRNEVLLKELVEFKSITAVEKSNTAAEISEIRASAAREVAAAHENARLREQVGRLERDQEMDKVRRLGFAAGPELKSSFGSKDHVLPKLTSSVYPNNRGTHLFIQLPWGEPEIGRCILEQHVRMVARPADNGGVLRGDYRIFGFCHEPVEGRLWAIAGATLAQGGHIKEAYGVETGGVCYVLLVTYLEYALPLRSAMVLPFSLLPPGTRMLPIPGLEHHITAFVPGIQSSDPLLAMIKDSSLSGRWGWMNSAARTHNNPDRMLLVFCSEPLAPEQFESLVIRSDSEPWENGMLTLLTFVRPFADESAAEAELVDLCVRVRLTWAWMETRGPLLPSARKMLVKGTKLTSTGSLRKYVDAKTMVLRPVLLQE